jgi:hypothetical protein
VCHKENDFYTTDTRLIVVTVDLGVAFRLLGRSRRRRRVGLSAELSSELQNVFFFVAIGAPA